MSEMTITASTRTISGRKTNQLRAEGEVPAVMYGFETEPTSLKLDRNNLERLLSKAGTSTVIKLDVEGSAHDVLIQEIQRHPISDDITHADFRRVDMSKKVEASISITLEGEAPAVKALGGTLLQSLEEIEVVALPSALMKEITVSVESLETFDDVLRVSDLKMPEGIELITDAEKAIASVQPPRSEEEMEALDEAVDGDVSNVEVTSEKKDEESEDGESKEESSDK